MTDPDRVRERWLELQDPASLAAVRERCQAAAVEERPVRFSWWAHRPQPFPREMAGNDPRRGDGQRDARLGVDAAGRPVYQRQGDEPDQLYVWTAPQLGRPGAWAALAGEGARVRVQRGRRARDDHDAPEQARPGARRRRGRRASGRTGRLPAGVR